MEAAAGGDGGGGGGDGGSGVLVRSLPATLVTALPSLGGPPSAVLCAILSIDTDSLLLLCRVVTLL